MGQSPRSFREHIVRPTTRTSQAIQRAKLKEMLVENIQGTANPNFALFQESRAIVVEERGLQEKFPTQTSGQSEDNNITWGLNREERRILKEKKGSRTEEKGSFFCALDRDPTSGKVPGETLSSVDLGVECEEGGSSAREKVQSHSPAVDGWFGGDNVLGYKIQFGREIKPFPRSPNTSRETTMSLGLEVEGDDDTCAGRSARSEVESLGMSEGTRPVSSGKVRLIQSKSQEKM